MSTSNYFTNLLLSNYFTLLFVGRTKTEGNTVQQENISVVSIFDAVTEVVHRQNRVLDKRLVMKNLKNKLCKCWKQRWSKKCSIFAFVRKFPHLTFVVSFVFSHLPVVDALSSTLVLHKYLYNSVSIIKSAHH